MTSLTKAEIHAELAGLCDLSQYWDESGPERKCRLHILDSQVLDNLVQAALRVQEHHPGQAHFMLVLRSDGEPALEERKREFRFKATALGVPVYDEMTNAGGALAALQGSERFLHKRQSAT